MSLNDNERKYPLVSIVIVTYNAAKDLQQCLDSIKKQSYPNLEIIVMDGGSTDGTGNIIKSNLDIINFWNSEPDNGVYDAMNKGLKHIHGEWVYFIGADDTLFDDFSKMLYEIKDPFTIYYGSTIFKGEKYVGYVSRYLHASIGICHQAIIYPISVFRKYSYDVNYTIAADRILNMKCYKDKKFTFQFLDYIIAHFADTGISSHQKDALFAKRKYWLVFKYFGWFVFWKVRKRLY